MDDQISISMGAKTDKTTNICRQTLLNTRWHSNSSGPSKKRQVFTALNIPHSSIQHQSTLLMIDNSKIKEISLKVMASSRQISSPNFQWNQLHLFLSPLLRVLISPSPSSLERVWTRTRFKLTNRQKTLTLFSTINSLSQQLTSCRPILKVVNNRANDISDFWMLPKLLPVEPIFRELWSSMNSLQ